jgi:signal transduction histidine kinase
VLQHFETSREKLSFVALLTLFVAVTALTLASVATQIGRPWPGFAVWDNLVAPAIGSASWPGVRAGIPFRRVVVRVDGQPVANADALRRRVRAVPVGTPLTYTFARGGRTTRVTVPTTILRWRHVAPAYAGYLVDGLAFLAAALLVFYFRPTLPAARAGLALSLLGLTLVLALDLFSAFWLERLYFCCESLTPGALLHFALCFPEEKRVVRRHPWLKVAVYVPLVPLALLQNLFLTTDPERHLMVNDWVYTAIAATGLLSAAALVHAYLTSRSPLARQQTKVVMAGGMAAALVPALGILAIVLLGLDVPMNLLAPFFLLYPLSIAYAIARHDLFAVDRYLRLGVVYVALSLVVFLSYAGLVLGAQHWLGPEGRLPTGVIPAWILVVLAVFGPLRARIQHAVDRLFYRQAYSYRRTIEATSRALASVLDTDRIATTVISTLTDVMTVEWAALVVLPDGDGEPLVYGRPPARTREVAACFPSGDRALARIAAGGRVTSRYELAAGGRRSNHGGDDWSRLHDLGVALVLPVRFEEQPIGVLMIGEKKSGAFYTDEDRDLLQTLVNQAAVALTNARAYEIIRRTQGELVHAERMAAVGELASAVAHGIRNPLAGIRAAAQVAREDLDPASDVAESLDDIISEADRLEHRVRAILDYARPLAPEAVPGDLNAFLERFVSAARQRLPAAVRLEIDLDPGMLPVAFHTAHLSEALDTIVVNAIEAMPGGGTLTIRSRLTTRNGEGSVAVVAVSDDGPGIDAGTIGRVFDLFFTTKESGTGVGLAMAKRLIERQGGTIAVESPPGAPTTFAIHLVVARRAGG